MDWELDGLFLTGSDTESFDQAFSANIGAETQTSSGTARRRMLLDLGAVAGATANDTLNWSLCRDGSESDTNADNVFVSDVLFEYDAS